MVLGDVSLGCAWALVDELVRSGVRHACLSPGSRSTPLALALSRHPSIELQVHLDERSSAFVALGIARATARPVIVACTSGTAATELFPAVVEASMSRVPLVLLTADRPPRLRGTGANQTIDQVDLYGSYAEYLEPPVPATEADAEAWRAAGRDAVLGAVHTWQPVQVNCPFDEPLMPSPDGPTPPSSETGAWDPFGVDPLPPEDVARLRSEISGARGAVVIGSTWPIDVSDVDLRVFDRPGWPVFAEPISNLRRPGTLAAGQALLGAEAWLSEHRPEVVLQLGATPTTRATQAFVACAEHLIVADRIHPDPDPEHRATWRLRADLPAVLAALHGGEIPAPDGWLPSWRDADARARAAIDAVMDGWDEPSEPRIARDVAAAVPDGGALLVGNSTPIRDLDLAMAPRDAIHVIANRGASGIDGLLSTAIGIASASGVPTTALIGDLSAIHDLGPLAWNAKRTDLDLTIVVVDNGGGQIFSLLPNPRPPEHRSLFVTPPELRLSETFDAFGLETARAHDPRDLASRTRVRDGRGIDVIHVQVSALPDREHREEIRRSVAAALA